LARFGFSRLIFAASSLRLKIGGDAEFLPNTLATVNGVVNVREEYMQFVRHVASGEVQMVEKKFTARLGAVGWRETSPTKTD
jgi:hypothetical protein